MLDRRFGGVERREKFLERLIPWCDRARQGAGDCRGGGRATCDVLPYIGTGNSLIAFGALDLIGKYGRVVFSDVSQDLLDHSRTLADVK